MAALDEKIVNRHRQQLETEERRLESEITRLRNYDDLDHGYTEDDNAMEVESFENNLGLVNSLDKTLQQVKLALRRIKEGKFGVCDLCGGFIESARLEISPETTVCSECAKTKQVTK